MWAAHLERLHVCLKVLLKGRTLSYIVIETQIGTKCILESGTFAIGWRLVAIRRIECRCFHKSW